jgi:hypothetical protein
MNDVWEGIPAEERPAWQAAARGVLARDDRGYEPLRLHLAPARFAALLLLEDPAAAVQARQDYESEWLARLSSPGGFHSFFHPRVHEDPETGHTYGGLFLDLLAVASASAGPLLGALAAAWDGYVASEPDSPLATDTLSIEANAVLSLARGKCAEWRELAEEMWDDWVAHQDILDDPFWRALRALASHDELRFVEELRAVMVRQTRFLETASGVPDRLAWTLITRCDVMRLHRLAASTTTFTLPELVPERARHFWEAQ